MSLSRPLFCAAAGFGLWLGQAGAAYAGPLVDELLAEFRAQGAGEFRAEAGRQLWTQTFPDPEQAGRTRSCATCHTDDLRQSGRHAKTGKAIKPLAPSANPERLTQRPEIEKWFLRNCKWTLGRECTPQEKGDILVYIQSQ